MPEVPFVGALDPRMEIIGIYHVSDPSEVPFMVTFLRRSITGSSNFRQRRNRLVLQAIAIALLDLVDELIGLVACG